MNKAEKDLLKAKKDLLRTIEKITLEQIRMAHKELDYALKEIQQPKIFLQGMKMGVNGHNTCDRERVGHMIGYLGNVERRILDAIGHLGIFRGRIEEEKRKK